MNFKNIKQNGYFLDFIKKGYCWFSLLISAIIMAGIVICYEYGFFNLLFKYKRLMTYFCIAISIFSIATLFFYYISTKSKKINIGDSFIFALLLTGIFYFLYCAIFKSLNLTRILVALGLIILGAVLALIAKIRYSPNITPATTQLQNSFLNYLRCLVDKYSFITIVLAIIISSSLFFLLFDTSVKNVFLDTVSRSPELYAIVIICAISVLAFLISGTLYKRINMVDVALMGLFPSFTIALSQLLLINETSTNRLIALSVMFVIFLGLVVIRKFRFDVNAIMPEDNQSYLKTLIGKYNPFMIVGLGIFILTTVSLIYAFDLVPEILKLFTGGFSAKVVFLPFGIIAVFDVAIVIVGIVAMLFKLKSQKVNTFDVLNVATTIAITLSLLLIIKIRTPLVIAGIVVLFALSLATTILRFISYRKLAKKD